jgi:hypothetical protein
MELDMKDVASYLWKLLDDIDTASDIANGDPDVYRHLVQNIQRKRFEVGDTDGHTVVFVPNYFGKRLGENVSPD